MFWLFMLARCAVSACWGKTTSQPENLRPVYRFARRRKQKTGGKSSVTAQPPTWPETAAPPPAEGRKPQLDGEPREA
jgi:hypothetical protein